MSEALPAFRYHPDPVGTGFVEPSSTACVACGRQRGFTCTATFTDDAGIPANVPMPVIAEITRRTPGFSAWQQEHWLYHCGGGCAFLGVVGRKELDPYPDAIEVLRCLHCGTHLAFSDYT